LLNRFRPLDDNRYDAVENTASSPDGLHERRDDDDDDNTAMDGGFGDDFDDFEQGGEGDDFGDFDDGFQQDNEDAETAFPSPSARLSMPGIPAGLVSQHSLNPNQLYHKACMTSL
jgi:hypothetical protein